MSNLDIEGVNKTIDSYYRLNGRYIKYPELAEIYGVSNFEMMRFVQENGISLRPSSPEISFEATAQPLEEFHEEPDDETLTAPDKNTHTSTDTHEIFHFKGMSVPYAVPKKTWEAIVRDYSDYGPTGRNTVKDIANKYSVPKKTLEKMLRSSGHTHASAPFTPDRIMEEEIEPLSEEAVEYKEHQVISKIEAKRFNKAIKENEELRERLHSRSSAIREITEEFLDVARDMPSAPAHRPNQTPRTGLVYHAPLADVHAGLHVWGKELWSNDYNVEESTQRIKDHAVQSCDWIASQPDCKEVYVSDLGDAYHALLNSTENGTPLQQDTRAKKVWRNTCEAKIEAIRTFLEVAPKVKVISTPGNHDHLLNFIMYESLAMYFNNDERVEFLSTVQPQSYFVIDSTMHLILHGTKIGQLTAPKSKATLEVIARQTAGKDYSKIKKIKAYVGHLHNSQVETQGGHMELIRLPAACETDDYAQGLGFYHEPGARIFQLDATGDIQVEKRVHF